MLGLFPYSPLVEPPGWELVQAGAEAALDDGLEGPRVLYPLDQADVRGDRHHLGGCSMGRSHHLSNERHRSRPMALVAECTTRRRKPRYASAIILERNTHFFLKFHPCIEGFFPPPLSYLVGLVGEPRAPAARRSCHDRIHDLEKLLHPLVHSQVFPSLHLQAAPVNLVRSLHASTPTLTNRNYRQQPQQRKAWDNRKADRKLSSTTTELQHHLPESRIISIGHAADTETLPRRARQLGTREIYPPSVSPTKHPPTRRDQSNPLAPPRVDSRSPRTCGPAHRLRAW